MDIKVLDSSEIVPAPPKTLAQYADLYLAFAALPDGKCLAVKLDRRQVARLRNRLWAHYPGVHSLRYNPANETAYIQKQKLKPKQGMRKWKGTK